MNKISIYKAESSTEGLASKIKASCSVAYDVPVLPWESDNLATQKIIANLIKEAVANLNLDNLDKRELFPTKSVLVSTNWNRNDDVFDRLETWAARHTPIHKPTNIEHDENKLVGHMVHVWAVNHEGNILDDDLLIDDLPLLFHLCTASVIYKNWEDPELIDRVNKLIADIENNEMFVSMECLFSNFDYAVVDPSNNSYIVPRNESSAFLTKHLRSYGGTGEFEGHKLGRLLRNISFCGKGYVKKPANPNSVTFTDELNFDFVKASHKNPFIRKSGVYSNKQLVTGVSGADVNMWKVAAETHGTAYIKSEDIEENSRMSTNEIDLLKEQLKETRDALKDAVDAKETAEKQLAEADTAKFETKIKDLENQVNNAQEETKLHSGSLSDAESKIKELTEANASLEETKTKLEKEVEQIKKEKVQTARVSSLVSGGMTKDNAETTVKKFEYLNDEQFEAVSEALIKTKISEDVQTSENAESNEQTGSDEEDNAEANANDEVLENAEANNDENTGGAVDTSDEDDELQQTRAGLVKYMSSRLNYVGASKSDDE